MSLLLTSRVHTIWLGYLTYGIGVGIAVACAYVPMVATVGAWFLQRRTAALGVAVAGIGVGTLVLAPLSDRLIDAHGWRTAYVVLGIGGALLLLLASCGAWRPPVTVAQAPVELRVVARDRGFIILYVSILTLSAALFTPFVFIKSYATDHGIDAGPAAALVGIIGASSVVGRLGLGALGARLGATRLTQLSFVVLTASYLIWLAAGDSYAMLVAFAIVMGVAYGGFIALTPAVAAEAVRDGRPRRRARRAVHGGRGGRARRAADHRGRHRRRLLRRRHRPVDGDQRRGDRRAVHAPGRPRPPLTPIVARSSSGRPVVRVSICR